MGEEPCELAHCYANLNQHYGGFILDFKRKICAKKTLVDRSVSFLFILTTLCCANVNHEKGLDNFFDLEFYDLLFFFSSLPNSATVNRAGDPIQGVPAKLDYEVSHYA